MNYRLLILILIFNTGMVAFAKAPNIIVFFSDDAGYIDFGFQKDHDPRFKSITPHLNQFAKEGAICEQGYVSAPVCSPSRAGLLTGRYQERFGHEMNLTNEHYDQGLGMPLSEKTMGDYMREAGYKTACIGKWHLGRDQQYHPNNRGFDYFYGCISGSRGYFPLDKSNPKGKIGWVEENGNYIDESKMNYITDSLGDAAVKFVENNKEEPFLIYLSFTAPHGPLQAKKSVYEKIKHIPDEFLRGKNRRVYAAMLASMDENIGKVMKKIKDLGLDENTLMVFANDNGGPYDMGTDNGELRGYKGNLYEGGIRVPMAFRWKGVIPEGQRINEPMITLDFLPTFLASAQKDVKITNPLDGINLLPRLKSGQALPARSLFWRRFGPDNPIVIRKGDWKLIMPRNAPHTRYTSHGTPHTPELYHLGEDRREGLNLFGYYPKLQKELMTELETWEKGLTDPLWGTDVSKQTLEYHQKKVGKKPFAVKPIRIE